MVWHNDRAEIGDCPFCGFPMLLPDADDWRCPSCDAEGRRRLPREGPRTGTGRYGGPNR
jgi:hypothetical protein